MRISAPLLYRALMDDGLRPYDVNFATDREAIAILREFPDATIRDWPSAAAIAASVETHLENVDSDAPPPETDALLLGDAISRCLALVSSTAVTIATILAIFGLCLHIWRAMHGS